MTDKEVMSYAKRALAFAAMADPGSAERAKRFVPYDQAVKELQRRMAEHAMRQVNKQLGLPDTGFKL